MSDETAMRNEKDVSGEGGRYFVVVETVVTTGTDTGQAARFVFRYG